MSLVDRGWLCASHFVYSVAPRASFTLENREPHKHDYRDSVLVVNPTHWSEPSFFFSCDGVCGSASSSTSLSSRHRELVSRVFELSRSSFAWGSHRLPDFRKIERSLSLKLGVCLVLLAFSPPAVCHLKSRYYIQSVKNITSAK